MKICVDICSPTKYFIAVIEQITAITVLTAILIFYTRIKVVQNNSRDRYEPK